MTWTRDTQLLIWEEIVLCFSTEENKNFILIISFPFSLLLFIYQKKMHGRIHKLAIPEVLANHVAILLRLDILHLLSGLHPLLCCSCMSSALCPAIVLYHVIYHVHS